MVSMYNYNFSKSKFQTYSFNINNIDTKEKEIVHLFWTGGWDSSFRVLELSRKKILIQPIYLDDNRASAERELQAIDSIANKIRKLTSTKCKIYDLLILNTSEVETDIDITLAYDNLCKLIPLGGQYDWLARFAKSYKGIELCIQNDGGSLIEYMKSIGKLKKIPSMEKGDYYILSELCNDSDLINVFGNFHFPLIDYTKLEMKKEANLKGYAEILDITWFCHTPINNEPCGLCNPCKYTIEQGMEDRFTTNAIRRYKFNEIKKYFKKNIKNILKKSKLL